ncbi:STAS domain-containing protein [Solirubrobacter phytolaccae]|uniref:Anti-sigma factor antagonist n=1 Tax=Solirubrobacter phytolaccae TaxID=1404360 RepID=A0A9X3SEC8_9ACTN|nr:STAS domain-containing protein [Solirubrobacter phytolaccae]MDA0184760.1 STAS domain-containing protein [Solirubrobacter phytolaccae]
MAAPSTSPLTAEVVDGPVPVIRVRGELDLSTAPKLCRTVERVAGNRRVMIDLSELEFCDSTGLRALVRATREIEINGGRAALVVPEDGVLARILELSGLGEFLRVASSPAEALRRLGFS